MSGDYITFTVRIPLDERFATYDECPAPTDVVHFLHDEYGSPASVICDLGDRPGTESRWECRWNGLRICDSWPGSP